VLGEREGADDGVRDGDLVSPTFVGAAVVLVEGVAEGIGVVGLAEGDRDGALEGLAEGDREGLNEGDMEGFADGGGTEEGHDEGLPDGDTVGGAVVGQ